MRANTLARVLPTVLAVAILVWALACACAAEEGKASPATPGEGGVAAPEGAGSPAADAKQPANPRRGRGRGNGDAGGAMMLMAFFGVAGLAPLPLLVTAAWPLFVRRTSVAVSRFRLHTVLWGVAASFLLIVLALVFSEGAVALTYILILGWLALGAIGFSGFAMNAGQRLLERDGTGLPSRPLICTFAGLIVCGWVFVIPVLGWLLLLAAIVVGTGASMQALFKAERMDEATPTPARPAPSRAAPQVRSVAPPTIVSATESPTPATAASRAAPAAEVRATPPPPAREQGVLDVNLDEPDVENAGGEEPAGPQGQEQ